MRFGVLLWGCVHQVVIDSDPPGAAVRLDGELLGYTPLEVEVPWEPGPAKDYHMVLRLTGHRRIETSLQGEMRLWGPLWQNLWHPIRWIRGCPEEGVRRSECPDHSLQFVMVEDHGAAGTWSPEELP